MATIAVAISIDEICDAVGGTVLVHFTVAVVVEAVADFHLSGRGIAHRLSGDALLVPGAAPVVVGGLTRWRNDLLINLAIAVVVETVANLFLWQRCVAIREPFRGADAFPCAEGGPWLSARCGVPQIGHCVGARTGFLHRRADTLLTVESIGTSLEVVTTAGAIRVQLPAILKAEGCIVTGKAGAIGGIVARPTVGQEGSDADIDDSIPFGPYGTAVVVEGALFDTGRRANEAVALVNTGKAVAVRRRLALLTGGTRRDIPQVPVGHVVEDEQVILTRVAGHDGCPSRVHGVPICAGVGVSWIAAASGQQGQCNGDGCKYSHGAPPGLFGHSAVPHSSPPISGGATPKAQRNLFLPMITGGYEFLLCGIE